jgi:hypothetical protein
MTRSIASILLQVCSKFLIGLGAVIFLVGDKFLHSVAKLPFLLAEVLGISSGIVLMIIGATLGPAKKRTSSE